MNPITLYIDRECAWAASEWGGVTVLTPLSASQCEVVLW